MNHLSVWLRLAVRVLRLWSVCVAWMPLCWPYTLARSSDARSTAKKLLFYLALTAYLSWRFRTRAKFDRIFFASIVRTVYRAIRQPSVRCSPWKLETKIGTTRVPTIFHAFPTPKHGSRFNQNWKTTARKKSTEISPLRFLRVPLVPFKRGNEPEVYRSRFSSAI